MKDFNGSKGLAPENAVVGIDPAEPGTDKTAELSTMIIGDGTASNPYQVVTIFGPREPGFGVRVRQWEDE